ncbi:LAFE_0E00760g1_1 [Lachancea fermentati]|uniref:Phosphoacetylglucosamine mutase n=1 Tax=Lachancea fermentati TaxID=4955 RepID=A0A1G4MCE2_LACFM|nr:LAFE_0E00760g1_1 [Lachancea fermentati]
MSKFTITEQQYRKHCKTGFKYSYGTAGFRYKADVLDTVMFTTGILAALRSIYLGGQTIGVMITASHNPPEDNGVKIIDPKGEMLAQSWEAFATDLANAASQGYEELVRATTKLVSQLQLDVCDSGNISVARDSRESGPRLLQALIDGINIFKEVSIVDYGLLTTPQLHFLTWKSNEQKDRKWVELDYYEEFLSSWFEIATLSGVKSLPFSVQIDAANGIGASKIQEMLLNIDFFRSKITLVNSNWQNSQLLNFSCGADYVKTNQRLPNGVQLNPKDNCVCCSFDGDADRVVFYYVDQQGVFHLLDGDKISSLLGKFFQKLLSDAYLENDVKLGIVQTAYANGSSTRYLQETLKIPVSCTSTGVKHLHHEAINSYDIGIYFEANGHGTVIFSDILVEKIDKRIQEKNLADSEARSLRLLKAFTKLINQTVGDAISDMLTVLAILCIMKWGPSDWDHEYIDLPNKLVKVVVPDRTLFTTTNAERQLVTPEGLQSKIDSTVAKYDLGRSFVRASGTEDAVRVYAEAATRQHAESLAKEITALLKS